MRHTIQQVLCQAAICAIGAMVAMRPADAAELVIVQDGQPRATIVVAKYAAGPAKQKTKRRPRSCRPMSRRSPGRSCRSRMIRRTRPGTAHPGRPEPVERWPGHRRFRLALLLPAAKKASSSLAKATGCCLAGNNDGPYHGTEYAVYDFLRSLGVRWFMPSEFGEIVPHATTIRVPEQKMEQKPDFVMRNWWLHALPELAAEEARWKLRNKMNPEPMFAICGDSSARAIVVPEALRKEKPALLALNEDGTRNPYLPNLTNPEAAKVAGGIIRDDLRKHPEANSYGFAPDDGLPRDFNPETLKLSRGFVTLGGRPGVAGEASITEEWLTVCQPCGGRGA